jgi:hypothetical protein
MATRELMERIAKDYNLNAEELVSKYVKAKARAATVVVTDTAPKCSATTAKGKPCAAKPLSGTCLCRVHTKKESSEAGPSTSPPPTPKKAKKEAAKPPMHTHTLDNTVHDDCELCQSHGNPLAETEEEYETVSSPPRTLRERLMHLAAESDFEDEDADD